MTPRGEPIVGAVPLAILTWWSLATPILAVLGLLLGWPHPPSVKGTRR